MSLPSRYFRTEGDSRAKLSRLRSRVRAPSAPPFLRFSNCRGCVRGFSVPAWSLRVSARPLGRRPLHRAAHLDAEAPPVALPLAVWSVPLESTRCYFRGLSQRFKGHC